MSEHNLPKLQTAKVKMLARAHFSDLCFLYSQFTLANGNVQPFIDYSVHQADGWRFTTSVSTLTFASDFMQLQSETDKPVKVNDKKFLTATASVMVDGSLKFPATPGDQFPVTIAYRLATGPATLEPTYSGDNAILRDLSVLIAQYRAGANIASLNSRWVLSPDSVVPTDRPIDPMQWYGAAIAGDPTRLLGIIEHGNQRLIILANQRSIIAIIPQRRDDGSFAYALGLYDDASIPLNNMFFWDRSILHGLAIAQ